MNTIRIGTDARGVATLTLARPEKHNAMSGEMMDELAEAAGAAWRAMRRCASWCLTGDGASFCAGGDLGWMRAQIEADGAQRAEEAERLAAMLGALNALPKPLIGRVQGNAFGGGVGLIAVCDVAIGAAGARIGLTETRLGLIPATIGPYVVARMGEAMARRVFMSAPVFDAGRGGGAGPAGPGGAGGELDAAVEAEVAPYLGWRRGRWPRPRRWCAGSGGRIDAGRWPSSIDALVARWESEEAREGIAAFFDKRKPAWAR